MNKVINTDKAPKAIGPYSQAILAGNTLYISGQIPINPETGKIVEGGITEQTTRCRIRHQWDVVKSTCLLSTMDNFGAMNEVYGRYYPQNSPARAAYAVQKLPMGVMVEIETIAVK